MTDFLRHIALTEVERAKLRALGAATPFALLALRKAARAAFDSHLGPLRAEEIAGELEKLLTDDARGTLAPALHQGGALGARLGPMPPDKRPK